MIHNSNFWRLVPTFNPEKHETTNVVVEQYSLIGTSIINGTMYFMLAKLDENNNYDIHKVISRPQKTLGTVEGFFPTKDLAKKEYIKSLDSAISELRENINEMNAKISTVENLKKTVEAY